MPVDYDDPIAVASHWLVEVVKTRNARYEETHHADWNARAGGLVGRLAWLRPTLALYGDDPAPVETPHGDGEFTTVTFEDAGTYLRVVLRRATARWTNHTPQWRTWDIQHNAPGPGSAVTEDTVSVGTTTTVVAVHPNPEAVTGERNDARHFVLRKPTGTDVFMRFTSPVTAYTGPGSITATTGFRWPAASTTCRMELEPWTRTTLYGVVASGSQAVDVIGVAT